MSYMTHSLEKINIAYEQQFDNMQRMNQKWLDLFSKSWEHELLDVGFY